MQGTKHGLDGASPLISVFVGGGVAEVSVHGMGREAMVQERIWPRLLVISVLSFPTVALSVACFALGSLTGLHELEEASITSLPLSSLLGLIVVTFAGLAANDLARRESVPRWGARAAWLLVVVGGLLQIGLVVAVMTPGLVELP
jgi:hypothetical protein